METKDNNSWKDTIKKAEVAPSKDVWKGIEFQLDKQEVVQLRGEVQYYKRLAAAACVTIALLAMGGAYTWLSTLTDSTARLQPIATSEKNAESNDERSGYSIENKLPEEQNDETVQTVKHSHKPEIKSLSGSEKLTNNSFSNAGQFTSTNWLDKKPTLLLSMYGQDDALVIANPSNLLVSHDDGHAHSNASASSNPSPTELATGEPETIELPLAKDLTENPDLYGYSERGKRETEKAEKKREERFWTAVGFSAGTFSNVTPSGSNIPTSLLRSSAGGETAAAESNSPGQAYSVNVSVGTKVARRWIVQGGMSYISQSSDYTANSVVASEAPARPTFSVASINEFEKQLSNENTKDAILASTPYTVNNTIQIISIPVQAGFVVFERKLALQLNSGVSTDLFMQNTLTPNAENLEKTTQGRGDDSPYRPVNFSGLVGTELSYKFGNNYRVSLSPGLRYPFNSIYKTDLGLRSSPLTFDVAVRFRYIFQ